MPSIWWIKPLLAICAGTVLFCAGGYFGANHVQRKWDVAGAESIKSTMALHVAAFEKAREWAEKLQEAQNSATLREQKLRAERDAARTAAVSLRNTIAARRDELPATTTDACRQTAASALDLLSTCAERYTAVAAAADAHASDVRMMQAAWPE